METVSIAPGERIRLSGGYEFELRWLCGETHYNGTVHGFIPGQNVMPACVVLLDKPISFDGVNGAILVLELRYAGASWRESGIVHVELCEEFPEAKRWQDRRQGKWVESHAAYARLSQTSATR